MAWHLAMFAAAILVPTLALGIALLWQFAIREQARLEQLARDAAQDRVADIDRDLTAETAVLQTLAASPLLRSRDFNAFLKVAKEAARVLDVDVVVRDRTGQRLLDTLDRANASRSQDGLVDVQRRALAGHGPVFSGIYISEDRQPIVSAYMSVPQDGVPILLLGLERRAARVRELVLQSRLPEGWRSGIIDGNHNIIARGTLHDEYVGKPSTADFSAHVIGDSGLWRGKNQEGIEVVSAYARSRLSGWYAQVGIPTHILEAPLRNALGLVVAVAAVSGFLALGLAWLFGRRIATPMRALVEAAGALGRGEAVTPLVTPLREANELGRAFHDAADLLLQRTAALDQSLQRTTEVLESIGDGFYAIDGNWRFTYVNHRALELMGMTADIILGRPFLEIFPHLAGGEIETTCRQAMADGRPREFETMSPMFGHWLSLSVYPQVGGGLSVYFRDVSAQRAAMAELSASEERLRLAQEAGDIGTWEMRPEAGRLIWSNSLYRLTGLDPATTPPSYEAYLSIVHPDDRPRVLALAQRVSEASGSYIAEYRIIRASDGAVRWLATRGVVSGGTDDVPVRMLGVVTDVTERRVAIDAMTRVQELQAELIHVGRLTEMGQMAAALAHELNQPLAGILNYVQASRRMIRRGAADTEQVDATLEKAAAQTQRASEIIRRLRAFVATGEVRRQAEQVASVIEDAVALALVGTAQRELRPRINIGQGLPPVLIDMIQIQQVLVNLIRNAVDAMEITQRYELVIAAKAEGDDRVEVSVCDSGPGLGPEVASRLFQPFTTTKPGGIGVGLSICRTIVQAHGGLIWTEPNPDGGTIFRFTVPTATAA